MLHLVRDVCCLVYFVLLCVVVLFVRMFERARLRIRGLDCFVCVVVDMLCCVWCFVLLCCVCGAPFVVECVGLVLCVVG